MLINVVVIRLLQKLPKLSTFKNVLQYLGPDSLQPVTGTALRLAQCFSQVKSRRKSVLSLFVGNDSTEVMKKEINC